MSTALVLPVAVKVALLLGLALVVVTILRRGAPETRHRVLALALAGSIVLPALVALLPGWEVVPYPWTRRGPLGTPLGAPVETVASAQGVSAPAPARAEPVSTPVSATVAPRVDTPSPARRWRPSVPALLAWTWAAGTAALLGVLLLQVASLRHLVRRARPLETPEWRARLERACRKLGLEPAVELRLAGPGVMPLAWGLRRPVVLLPDEALGWSEQRAAAVLGHELAHVSRGDVAWSLVARVARALHWFDPLAWVLHRRLRGAAEHAADALALAQGLRPADYAEHLLEVAATASRRHALAPIMATRTDLEERIMAVLKVRGSVRASRAARLVPAVATLALLAPLASLGWARAGQETTTLTGFVSGPDGPLDDATVLIARAKPREGVAILCPSCYLDCGKRTQTDDEGRFVFEDLDPTLTFQVLVYRDGHVPVYSKGWSDPAHGPVAVDLEPSDLDERPPERVIRGRVVDADGRPIEHATVQPFGRIMQDGRMYGRPRDVDPLAVTDEEGRFALGVQLPGDDVLLEFEAPNYAPTTAPSLKAGVGGTVTLLRGANVTGVVTKDGEPVAGIEVGLVQPQGTSSTGNDTFTGELTVGTDESGRFTFANVEPGQTWLLYGKMTSLGARGALPVRPVEVEDDLSTIDLGRLELEPARRLSGRVVLSDGRPAADASVALGREAASMDGLTTRTTADGSFTLVGVPDEQVSLQAWVDGHTVSPRNESFDFLNERWLVGTISGDIEGLIILMQPGEDPTSFSVSGGGKELWERYQELLRAPLRGVPPDSVPEPGRGR